MYSPPKRHPIERMMRRFGRRILQRRPDWFCRDSLNRAPVPLYSEAVPLAVMFSPKAGCSFAAKWFFFQEGILEEALAYSAWPHDYRQEVLYRRPQYYEKLAAVPSLGPRIVKFVRDPYDRAVSGYLHFAQLAHAPNPVHALPVLQDIGDFLGRDADAGFTFTFRELVSYLAAIDLDTANPHFRRQISPCERVGRLREMQIVRIEESRERLPEIEADLGLPASDYAELRRSPHHTTRADLPGFFGDTPFDRTRNVAVPRNAAFYDDSLLEEIGRLYEEDCHTYGYAPPTLAPEQAPEIAG